MLNRVLDLVAKNGWDDVSRPFETTISFTRGHCLWLLLTRGGRSHTYVKFSEHADLALEAQRCSQASRCYPGLAPHFLGWACEQELQLLACRAVDYVGVSRYRLTQASAQRHFFNALLPYFEAMPAAQLPAELTRVNNQALLQAMATYFQAHPAWSMVQHSLQLARALGLAARDPMPQHGDLVLNNLGFVEGGGFVVFDWEDFGAVCLPGLDLFTLEVSLVGDAAGLWRARRDGEALSRQFVARACRLIGLAEADYFALTGLYALTFRYLKRNYGTDVRERMDQWLLELARFDEPAGL